MKKVMIITIVILGGLLLAITPVALSASNANPDWIQVNQDGFGEANNSVQSLEAYNGRLYAGTWSNDYGNFAAQIWRSEDGKNWSQVTPSWATANGIVFDMQAFGGQLYAGTANDNGGEIWRSSNGSSWEQVAFGGFSDINNNAVQSLVVFSDTIIAATSNITTGIEIWSSPTGDSGDWDQVNSDGFGNGPTAQDLTLDVFGDYIYAGIGRASSEQAELWRSDDGITWNPVFIDGLGDPNNTNVSAMEEYNGDFYLGLRNITTGGEVWRSNNGTDWTPVFTEGNGDPDNQRPYGLTNFNNKLYLTMINASSGVAVWESNGGLSWQVIADNGWGDAGNIYADYYDKGNAIFNGGLYLGTLNETGGEIWLYQSNHILLPLIMNGRGVCSIAPTLISPKMGSSLDTITPLFELDSGSDPNATYLRLQVAKDIDFTQNSISLYSSKSTGIYDFRSSRNLDPATTYYWRAWLICDDVESPFSEVWSFTTGSNGEILPAPTLVAPANGSKVASLPVTLRWSAVGGAVEYLIHYRVVGQSSYTYRWVTETQTDLESLGANTIYEWWGSARNNYAIGTDSTAWKFTSPNTSLMSTTRNDILFVENNDGSFSVIEENHSK